RHGREFTSFIAGPKSGPELIRIPCRFSPPIPRGRRTSLDANQLGTQTSVDSADYLLTGSGEVVTMIVTMSRYVATVIRTGNSYALRVPKGYVETAHLAIGDKAELALPRKQTQPNPARVLE